MKYHKIFSMILLGRTYFLNVDDVWIPVNEGIIGLVEIRPWR